MLRSLPAAIRPISRLFILQQFFSPMALLFPVMIPAMIDHGLTATTVATLMCCLYVTTFVFEIPSGVWADQYSRRKVLLWAEAICMAGFAMMGLLPNFIGFAIGLVSLSLRASLYSGTHDAYMYDELAYHDGAAHFGTLRGLTKIAQWAGVTIASLGVWVYHEQGWSLVVAFSVLARAIGFVLLWIMPEVGRFKTEEHVPFLQQTRESFRALRDNPALLKIGLYTCSFAPLFILYDYRTLLAQEWHLTPLLATLFVAGCSLAYCLGSALSVKLQWESWRTMLWVGFAAALSAAIASLWSGIPAAILMILAFFLVEYWLIRTGVMQQHATPSHVRASSGSIINFGASLFDIALAQTIGFFAGQPPRYVLPAQVLNTASFVLTAVLLVGYYLRNRKIGFNSYLSF